MEKYLDKSLSPEERAQDLLSKMSLEEKMGQIRLSGSFNVTEDLWIEGKARAFCAEGKAE